MVQIGAWQNAEIAAHPRSKSKALKPLDGLSRFHDLQDVNASNPFYTAFDIDGTVFSSESIIHEVYAKAIANYNAEFGDKLSIPTRERIMKEIGKPVVTIFRNLLPNTPEDERQKISNSVLDILCEQIKNGQGHFYDNISAILTRLSQKGVILLAASNGRKPYIETILTKANVLHLFKPVIVLGGEHIKTKGDILREYISLYSISPDRLIMIGDRESDFSAAKAVSCPFIFCSYGHADPLEVTEFSFQANTPAEILNFPGFL